LSFFPNSPQLMKAGIVLLDPNSGAVQRVINLQYNPDTLTRSLQPQRTVSNGRIKASLRTDAILERSI
jgi:hypothetical protein